MKLNFKSIVDGVRLFGKRRAPEIAIGLGIGGYLASIILAVKGTSKAVRMLDEATDNEPYELTMPEKLKITWKCYIPTAIAATASTISVIGGTKIGIKRNAALMTACALSETALKEYADKVKEVLGEKKHEAIQDSIAEDHVKNNPVKNNEVFLTNKGETLCYEPLSGRYFKSDIESIKRVVNELNRDMISDNYISLNELYDGLGLPDVKLGETIGWSIDHGYIEIHFSAAIADNGEPCIVLNHDNPPIYDYEWR